MQVRSVDSNIANTNFKAQSSLKEFNALKSAFQKKIKIFPNDYEYLKKLGASIGLNKNELFKLNSIMGAEELSQRLRVAKYEDFNPKDIILNEVYTESHLSKLAESDFRFNLHLHTNNSDGKMSVYNLLEQANQFSKKVAAKTPNKPFIFAITDHDTLDGCQEAVKLIAKNPLKYKHLSIVLGSELSAVYKDPETLNKPISYEMVAYSIDPFDNQLNKTLKDLRCERIILAHKIIDEAKEKYPNADYSYDEACKYNVNPQKGMHGFLYTLASYFGSKAQKLNFVINTEDLCLKYLPNYQEQRFKITQEAEEIFAILKKGFGFLGIAHPGKINLGNGRIKQDFVDKCKIEEVNSGKKVIEKFVTHLKKIGQSRFNALEINYQSYEGKLGEAQKMIHENQSIDKSKEGVDWLLNFKKLAKKLNLLEAGGLDTHRGNPFIRK